MTPAPDDRRRHERLACSFPVSCRGVAGGGQEPWRTGEALNISRGGLLLVSEYRYEARTVLKVRVGTGVAETALLLTAQVMRICQLAEGKWLLGCQVAPEFRTDEIERLLSRNGQDDGESG